MTAPLPALPDRPRLVDMAFWCFVAGAVIMIVGGLMAATADYEAARAFLPDTFGDEQVRSYVIIYRAVGIGSVLVAGALAFLAGRARQGDARFRRAVLGLAFTAVVVIVLVTVGLGVAQPIVLLSLFPVLVGAALLSMPVARRWYESAG